MQGEREAPDRTVFWTFANDEPIPPVNDEILHFEQGYCLLLDSCSRQHGESCTVECCVRCDLLVRSKHGSEHCHGVAGESRADLGSYMMRFLDSEVGIFERPHGCGEIEYALRVQH